MSQGKRTHQSFLQWGTKKRSFRLKPKQDDHFFFFLDNFFLFKHIPFLNRIFRFVPTSTLVDLFKNIFQERSNKNTPSVNDSHQKRGHSDTGTEPFSFSKKSHAFYPFFFPSQTTQVQLITPQRTYVGSLRTSVPSTPSNRKHQRGISQAKSRFTHQDLPRSHWSHTSA